MSSTTRDVVDVLLGPPPEQVLAVVPDDATETPEACGGRLERALEKRGGPAHLLDALDELGLLGSHGQIEVDVLKLPHHGSDRNVTADFFERVIAHTYAISANGRYDNPDRRTLEMLLASAKAAGRSFVLVATNHAPGLDEFVVAHPPEANNYSLRVRPDADHFIDVSIARPA